MNIDCIFQRMGRHTLYTEARLGTELCVRHDNLTHRARSIWGAGFASATLALFGSKLGALA